MGPNASKKVPSYQQANPVARPDQYLPAVTPFCSDPS